MAGLNIRGLKGIRVDPHCAGLPRGSVNLHVMHCIGETAKYGIRDMWEEKRRADGMVVIVTKLKESVHAVCVCASHCAGS